MQKNAVFTCNLYLKDFTFWLNICQVMRGLKSDKNLTIFNPRNLKICLKPRLLFKVFLE